MEQRAMLQGVAVAGPIGAWHIHWMLEPNPPFLFGGALLLCALACGAAPEGAQTWTEIDPLQPSEAEANGRELTARLPECGGVSEMLPELTNLLITDISPLLAAGGDFSVDPARGRAFVRSVTDSSMSIEAEGCCTFDLQRQRGVPISANVGDELEYSLRYAPAFSPEWTLLLNDPSGRLVYFRHNQRFDAERHRLMNVPFDIDLEASCSVASACYSTTRRLLVTVTSDTDHVTLDPRSRGELRIDGESYQVIDHLSAYLGGSSSCDDPSPPGEHLTLEVIPAEIQL